MFIACLLIPLAFAELQAVPAQVAWSSYNITSQVLRFEYPAYSDTSSAATYSVKVDFPSSGVILPDRSLLYADIRCDSNDGTALSISYKVLSSTSESPYSLSSTLFCAGVPDDIASISQTYSSNTVTLTWESGIANNGLPITGYEVQRTLTGVWEIVSTVSTTQFQDTIDYEQNYEYRIFVVNNIGKSSDPLVIAVTILEIADPSQSLVEIPVTFRSLYEFTVTVDLKDAAGQSITRPANLQLEFKNNCIVSQGFDCETNSDIIPESEYTSFTDNGDGSMSALYTPSKDGEFELSVLQLYSEAFYCEFWDNLWFQGNIAKELSFESNEELEIEWTEDSPVIDNIPNFVSAKCYAMVLPEYSETYTFTVTASSGIRLHINDRLLIDQWDSCCTDSSAEISLLNDKYYFLRMDLKHLEGSASFSLTWKSGSQAEEKIKKERFYKPVRVQSSPYAITVEIGKSSTELCTYTASTRIQAGKKEVISMTSIDVYGNILFNTNDVYSVEFILPGSDPIYMGSTYISNGISELEYTLLTIGDYQVNIKLYGFEIKDSPFTLSVTSGEASLINSTANLDSVGDITAGVETQINFTPIDVGGNSIVGTVENVSLVFIFVDNASYQNALNVAHPSDWETEFGINISGTYLNTHFLITVHRAGSYNGVVSINDSSIANMPVSISVVPGGIDASNSVFLYDSVHTAGLDYIYRVQTRDSFHNNLLITDLNSPAQEATGPETVTGLIENESPGVYKATVRLTIAGTYTIKTSFNSVQFPDLASIVVNPESVSSASQSLLEVSNTNVRAGETVQCKISSKDSFGNLRTSSTDIFTASLDGTTQLSTPTNNNDGSFTLNFEISAIGSYQLNVELDTVPIQGSGPTIVVSYANMSGINSRLVSYNQVQSADSIEQLEIEVRDTQNNLITDPADSGLLGNQAFYLSAKGPIIAEFQAITENSVYKFNIGSLTTSGTYSLLLALEQSGGLLGSYYKDTNFSVLDSAFDYNNHSGDTPTAYTKIESTLSFDWEFDTSYNSFFSATWQGKLFVESTGIYTFFIHTDNLASFQIASSKIDTISTGVVSNDLSLAIALIENTFYDIEIKYVAGRRPCFLKIEWENLPSLSRGEIPSSSLYTRLTSPVSSLEITPGVTSTANSQVLKHPEDTDSITVATVGVEKTFRIETKDAYSNLVTQDSNSFVSKFSEASNEVIPTIELESLGTYKGRFTPLEDGIHALTVSLNGQQIGEIHITVYPGSAEIAEIRDLIDLTSGDEGNSLIFLKDAQNNYKISGGDSVSVSIRGNSNTVADQSILVTDNMDGTYSVKYRVYKADSYTFSALINSNQEFSSIFTVSHRSVSPIDSSTVVLNDQIALNSDVSVNITLYDSEGNYYTQLPSMHVFLRQETNPNFKDLEFPISLTDANQGLYQGTAQFALANIDTSGTCGSDPIDCNFTGTMALFAYILEDGLTLKIYEGTDWDGPPIYQTVQTDFTYTYSQIEGVTANNMSIILTGVIEPTTAGRHKLVLTVSGTGKLLINGKEVIDTSTSTEYTFNFETKKYEIQAMMASTSENPSLKLKWELENTNVTEEIPSEILFYYKDETPLGGVIHTITAV